MTGHVAHVLSYGLTGYLAWCLRQLAWMDEVLVLNGTEPFNGAPAFPDDTAAVVESLRVCGQKNLTLVRRAWATEHEARNFGQEYFEKKGCAACTMLDADDVLFAPDLIRLRLLCEREGVEAVLAHAIDYWKTALWVVEPRRASPTILHLRTGLRFYDGGCARHGGGEWVTDEAVRFHHFGFALSDAEMEWKAKTYWNKGDMAAGTHRVAAGWYETVWRAWRPEMENLGLVRPEFFRRAVRAPDSGGLPPELVAHSLRLRGAGNVTGTCVGTSHTRAGGQGICGHSENSSTTSASGSTIPDPNA